MTIGHWCCKRRSAIHHCATGHPVDNVRYLTIDDPPLSSPLTWCHQHFNVSRELPQGVSDSRQSAVVAAWGALLNIKNVSDYEVTSDLSTWQMRMGIFIMYSIQGSKCDKFMLKEILTPHILHVHMIRRTMLRTRYIAFCSNSPTIWCHVV